MNMRNAGEPREEVDDVVKGAKQRSIGVTNIPPDILASMREIYRCEDGGGTDAGAVKHCAIEYEKLRRAVKPEDSR